MSSITVAFSHSLKPPIQIESSTSFNLTNLPRSSSISVAGPSRRVSPTLYPTPPPTAIILLPGQFEPPVHNAISHFLTPQHVLPKSHDKEEDDTTQKELRVLEREAQLRADKQLRAVGCPWRQPYCDAVLGSVELLHRHLEKHLHNHDADDIRCFWGGCTHRDFASVDGLKRHINSVHIPNLVLYQTVPVDRTTKPVRRTPSPLPDLPCEVPSYFLTTPPVCPVPPAPIPIRREMPRTRGNRASPPSSSSSDKVWPIMRQRDPDDFWPMNGEADIHLSHYWPTSSIFPRIQPIDRTDLETKWYTLQTKGMWKQGYDMEFRKRSPVLPMFRGAGLLWRKHEAELEEERAATYKRVKAMGGEKGKGKAVEGGPEQDASGDEKSGTDVKKQRYSVDRITRASTRRARRVTGRTVGIAAIEEMIAFEARGVELGELPDDFSFAK